jgi:hypothetical protein
VTNTSPTAVLGIYAGYGGNFAAPPSIAATQVGTATLTFTSCGSGVLNYSFYGGRIGTIPLSRLTANITCGTSGDNGSAPSNYLLSGSWSQASAGGQGLVFDVNPTQKNFFAAWYTYAPNGQATGGAASELWYTIQAGFNPGDSRSRTRVYVTTGGVFRGYVSDHRAGRHREPHVHQLHCGDVDVRVYRRRGGPGGTLNLTRTGPPPTVRCRRMKLAPD